MDNETNQQEQESSVQRYNGRNQGAFGKHQHSAADAGTVKEAKPTKQPKRTAQEAGKMAGLQRVQIVNLPRNDARAAKPLDPNSQLAKYIADGRRNPFDKAAEASRKARVLQERQWRSEAAKEWEERNGKR